MIDTGPQSADPASRAGERAAAAGTAGSAAPPPALPTSIVVSVFAAMTWRTPRRKRSDAETSANTGATRGRRVMSTTPRSSLRTLKSSRISGPICTNINKSSSTVKNLATLAGVKLKKVGKGRILADLNGIRMIFCEILPLRKSNEKPRKTKEIHKKNQRKTKKNLFLLFTPNQRSTQEKPRKNHGKAEETQKKNHGKTKETHKKANYVLLFFLSFCII